MFTQKYKTKEGFSDIWMSSDGQVLTGLWFEGSKDEGKHVKGGEVKALPIFEEVSHWLDIYFSGENPSFTPACKIMGASPFRRSVLNRLMEIPYGELCSYGDIAKELAKERGIPKMSAQAVGGAVGWNPICLIIPCHRVVGSKGQLTGYGGGIENKRGLLRLEGHLEV